MNEEAQKILMDLLKKATNGIDSAVAFSQQQIPDVINQLPVWNVVSSIIYQVTSLAFIFVVSFIAVKLVRARHEKKPWTRERSIDMASESYILAIFVTTIGGGLIVIVAITTFFNNFDWLKIWLAPKLYLIEYAASLVK